jgi:acyl dehydratase
VETYSVVAFNTATASLNKIHDAAVAASLGFRGGLVPGVDVYAYLCHPPAERWGLDWLRHGTMRARFHAPVYDGDTSHVSSPDGERLELRDDEGGLCAEGAAALGEAVTPPDADDWPDVPQTTSPPPASPEVLVPGTAFGLEQHGFHAGNHAEYLADVREELPLYREARVAHPGWILRDANYVLSANVRLGPWIHVESAVQHFAPVEDGQVVGCRGVVTEEWEHKGHRFVRMDVLHTADGKPVTRTDHTAIYRPRGT